MKARQQGQCPLCREPIHRGQQVHKAHDECIVMARGTWADAYRVPERDHKAEFAAWLRMNGTPMGGRGA